MRTQAYFLVKYGKVDKAFELRDFILSEPKEDEVTIEVESFGINYADVMARNNLYKEAPPIPVVLGYDVVGKIIKTGKNIDSKFIGKRVLAFTRFGAYAKHVNTKENAFVVIDDIDSNIALALATQYVTAYYMTNIVTNIQKNDAVLIHAAAGGVGLALIQICQWKNANIIAKVSSEKKLKFLQELGIKQVVNYKKLEYYLELKKFLGSKKLDISFNAVAGSTFKKDISLLGSGGRLILFGGSELLSKKWGILSKLNFVCKMGIIIPIALMMKSKSLIGVNMLKIADNKPEILNLCMNKVLDLYKEKNISPIQGEKFSHNELTNAHEKLEKGNSIGKISIDWN